MMPLEDVDLYLEKENFTPKRLTFSMSYAVEKRPWLCLCYKENKEYLVVIYPNGNLTKTQIGIGEYLSWKQIVDKVVNLGYPNDHFLQHNLFFDVASTGEVYWYYPVDTQGKVSFFSLNGEPINQKPM